jgi:hypothetical protein
VTEHTHRCRVTQCPTPEGVLGCLCLCGATYHVTGWQKAKGIAGYETTEQPKNPCAVVYDEYDREFDIEEYRADLQRKYKALIDLASNCASVVATQRYRSKAAGIQIAMDTLPRRTQ